MQKEIIITEIKAKFIKSFETFSKMDPFLIFTIGKSQGKTETAENAGKQPIWKANITLNYFDEENIKIDAYEQDLTSNQFMGSAKIDVKTLKPSGSLQIKLMGQQQHIGDVFFKYTVKTLPPAPLLTIKNIRCSFYKQMKFMLKTKPYFGIQHGGNNTVTNHLDQSDGRNLHWKDEVLRVKIKQNQKLNFIVYDKQDNQSKIFSYYAFPKQFRTLSGSKCFNVIDSVYEPLGVITFDYLTQNYVNKEESSKNQEASKKDNNELKLITIEKIKGKVSLGSEDIYFKINLGPNMVKTQYIENAGKQFEIQANKQFYAQKKENKMIFAAFDKDIISDDILGAGELLLDNLQSGIKQVHLKNKEGKDFGVIKLVMMVQKVTCKSINLTNIKVQLKQGTDIIGQSEPYVIGRIGGWSGRTETKQGQKVVFDKGLNLKFSLENQMILEVWDEDINDHDKLFVETVKISELKSSGEMKIPLKGNKKAKAGQLYFKYSTSNVIKKEQPKKSEKKISDKKPLKQETIKKEESPKKPQILEKQLLNKSALQSLQKSEHGSIERSRQTFKLPSIAQSKNWGDKIYNKQSAATLQKSVHAYSMPKGNRFENRPKYQGQPSYYMDSCFKPNSGKGVGFGFGNKKQFPDWMVKNMKQVPAPTAYFDKQRSTSPDFRPKGPTFGIGHHYYEKVTIPREKSVPRQNQRLKPIGRP